MTPTDQPMSSATREPPSYSQLAAPYWEAASEGHIQIQHCDDCSTPIFPPRPLCPSCWSTAISWRRASGQAEVESFTVVHRAPNETFVGEVPYVVALVLLDEGPRLMTNIVGCAPEDVEIGMRVHAVFTQYNGFVLPQFAPELG